MRTAPALVALLLGTACAGPGAPAPAVAATPSAAALRFSDAVLAEGTVDGLPSGPLYINVIDITQQPGGNITHKHIAGFVYALTGTHRMAVEGGPTLDLAPGHAGFVGTNVPHSHLDPDPGPSDWWFLSIRPSTLRASTLVPGQKVIYATDDVATGDIPASGALVETLRADALEPGGHSGAHRHPGPVMLFVRSGSVTVKAAGQAVVTVASGSGTYLPAGAVEQESNLASTRAEYLVYSVTPAGSPAIEDVPKAP